MGEDKHLGILIDYSKGGDVWQYLNHACEPNTRIQVSEIDMDVRVDILALYEIQRDEAVTFNYLTTGTGYFL